MTTDVAERPRPTGDAGAADRPRRYRHRWVETTVASIYDDAERVKRRELRNAVNQLEARDELDDGQRKILEAMADAIVGRLLAAPTKQLRRATDWSSIAVALGLFDAEIPTDERTPIGGATAGGDR